MLVEQPLDGLTLLCSPRLADAGLPHGFTTRLGGVSRGPFASLNLGLVTGDEPKQVVANRERVAAALGFPLASLRLARQVHGAALVDAAEGAPGGSSEADGPAADGLLTDDPALLLSVRVADCLPVLLASPDGHVVAAVHAGWRGAAAGIVASAARQLAARAGVAERL
jgi:copper oxidase (laccase) domain-containing protein